MTEEEIYDKQISPKMQKVAEICRKNNINFYAIFRLDDKKTARSLLLSKNINLESVELELFPKDIDVDGYGSDLIHKEE